MADPQKPTNPDLIIPDGAEDLDAILSQALGVGAVGARQSRDVRSTQPIGQEELRSVGARPPKAASQAPVEHRPAKNADDDEGTFSPAPINTAEDRSFLDARRVTQADQETRARDKKLKAWSQKLSETRILEVKIARVAWFVAAIFFTTTVMFGGFLGWVLWSNLKTRPYYVMEKVDGSLELVQPAIEQQEGEYKKSVIDEQVRYFITGCYGVSDQHRLVIWPKLQTYWFPSGPMAEKFGQMLDREGKLAQAGGYLRNIVIRKLELDHKEAMQNKGGGWKYFYRVEFVEQDVEKESFRVIRSQKFAVRLTFLMGENYEEWTSDQRKLMLQKNIGNFVPLEVSEKELLNEVPIVGIAPQTSLENMPQPTTNPLFNPAPATLQPKK